MLQPAKPVSSPKAPPSDGGEQAAGSSLASAIASVALQNMKQKPKEDPDKKWEEMGAELYDSLEKKDKAGFGRLFAKQVKLAVKEAMRGNK